MIKKIGAFALVVGSGIYFCPDVTSLKTAMFAVSVICLITALFALVIGVKDKWGVLPGIDFNRDIERALSTPESAARVFHGLLIFLGLVMVAIMRAQ